MLFVYFACNIIIYILYFEKKVSRNFGGQRCYASQRMHNRPIHSSFTPENQPPRSRRIRQIVGKDGEVVGAVSGGVDSTVAAKLMKEAIGDR